MKVLKLFKKTIANDKRSIKIFLNKIIHLKPINNKRQVVKQNTDEFKYVGNTRTSDVGDNYDNDDDDDDDDDDGCDDGGNRVNGITVNGDVSNIKHLIDET